LGRLPTKALGEKDLAPEPIQRPAASQEGKTPKKRGTEEKNHQRVRSLSLPTPDGIKEKKTL
jgi:hypothetical protein